MDNEEIPMVVKEPPDRYDKLCNNPGKAGSKPNLYVNNRCKLYITHVHDLVVKGSLSDREYVETFCNYKSHGGVIHSESREQFLEFLEAVWQAVDYLDEFEDELKEAGIDLE